MSIPFKSMDFGKMPSEEEFNDAYERELRGKKYSIFNCKIVGEGYYSCEELFSLVKSLVESGEDEKELLASGIMFTLGFEWI